MSDKKIIYGINQRITLKRVFCDEAKTLYAWKVLGPSAKAMLLDMIAFKFMEGNFPFKIEGTGKRRKVQIKFEWNTGTGQTIVIEKAIPMANLENVSI